LLFEAAVFDALKLDLLCGDSRPQRKMPRVLPLQNTSSAVIEKYVSLNGSDAWPGTLAQPFRTLSYAVGAIRLLRVSANVVPASITLFAGKYCLNDTLVLTFLDSHLTIQRYNDDIVELSGGVELTSLKWHQLPNSEVYYSKLMSPHFTTLFVDGRRAIRARHPNGNPETTGANQWFANGTWMLPVLPAQPLVEVHVASPVRQSMFAQYEYGLGGTASVFEPARSYWALVHPCEREPPPLECGQYMTMSGVISSSNALPVPPYKNATSGVAHVMQDDGWGSMMFQIAKATAIGNSSALYFAPGGGGQQGRNAAQGSIWFVENLLELLDSANEWFFDESARVVFFYPNGTVDPSQQQFTRTNLKQLIVVDAAQDMPARNISLRGITFSETEPTFMDVFTVPSAGERVDSELLQHQSPLGDVTVQKSAAVYVGGSVGFAMEGCRFDRVGGNALFLANFTRDARIIGNEFVWTGLRVSASKRAD
jgi:hypothetical protein